MPITFRFRPVPFVAALVVIAIGIALGQWQTGRAAQKQAIEQRLAARASDAPVVLRGTAAAADAMEFRRVIVAGEFVRDWPVYLDNRPYQGRAGFYLLMPFRIAGSDMTVLVNRGWLPRDPADRTRLPQIAAPAGTVEIQGMARRNTGHVLQLGSAPALKPGAIVQNAGIDEFAQASGLRLLPFIIEQSGNQSGNTADNLVRDWPRPSTGIDKHLGYAFQWYALAAMAFIFFIVTGFRRGTR